MTLDAIYSIETSLTSLGLSLPGKGMREGKEGREGVPECPNP